METLETVEEKLNEFERRILEKRGKDPWFLIKPILHWTLKDFSHRRVYFSLNKASNKPIFHSTTLFRKHLICLLSRVPQLNSLNLNTKNSTYCNSWVYSKAFSILVPNNKDITKDISSINQTSSCLIIFCNLTYHFSQRWATY